MTKEQAQEIIYAHEIHSMMQDAEERRMLKENNPELYSAYKALLKLADKADNTLLKR